MEHDAGRDQEEVEVEVGDAEEGAGHEESIEGELGHFRVLGEVAVLRMAAPPLPEATETPQRAQKK
jgi:hypothetical protein